MSINDHDSLAARAEAGRAMAQQVLSDIDVRGIADWSDYQWMTMSQLFAEIWTLPELSMRDKRLLVLGVLAAVGKQEKFGIHLTSALRNGEFTAAQAREIPLLLVHYVGHPLGSDLPGVAEDAIRAAGVTG